MNLDARKCWKSVIKNENDQKVPDTNWLNKIVFFAKKIYENSKN